MTNKHVSISAARFSLAETETLDRISSPTRAYRISLRSATQQNLLCLLLLYRTAIRLCINSSYELAKCKRKSSEYRPVKRKLTGAKRSEIGARSCYAFRL
jgi:hypothetical protein